MTVVPADAAGKICQVLESLSMSRHFSPQKAAQLQSTNFSIREAISRYRPFRPLVLSPSADAGQPTCTAWSSNGKYVAAGFYTARVLVFDTLDGVVVQDFLLGAAEGEAITFVDFSPDSQSLFANGRNALHSWAVAGWQHRIVPHITMQVDISLVSRFHFTTLLAAAHGVLGAYGFKVYAFGPVLLQNGTVRKTLNDAC